MDCKAGKLFILYGPSGAGKSTLMSEILKKNSDILTPIITYTTRPARATEIHAKDYYFITYEEFLLKQSQDKFIHVTTYLNNRYGASKDIIADLKAGKNLIAIFDRAGAQEVKNSIPCSVLIWIAAPINELEKRLRSRYTQNPEQFASRFAQVKEDIAIEAAEKILDYEVTNSDLEKALKDLESIIKKELSIKKC
jgi:guanylate kinase